MSLTKPGLRNIKPITIYMPHKMRIRLKMYTTNSPLLVSKIAWFQLANMTSVTCVGDIEERPQEESCLAIYNRNANNTPQRHCFYDKILRMVREMRNLHLPGFICPICCKKLVYLRVKEY